MVLSFLPREMELPNLLKNDEILSKVNLRALVNDRGARPYSKAVFFVKANSPNIP